MPPDPLSSDRGGEDPAPDSGAFKRPPGVESKPAPEPPTAGLQPSNGNNNIAGVVPGARSNAEKPADAPQLAAKDGKQPHGERMLSPQQIMRARYRQQMMPPRTWVQQQQQDKEREVLANQRTIKSRSVAAAAAKLSTQHQPQLQQVPDPAAATTARTVRGTAYRPLSLKQAQSPQTLASAASTRKESAPAPDESHDQQQRHQAQRRPSAASIASAGSQSRQQDSPNRVQTVATTTSAGTVSARPSSNFNAAGRAGAPIAQHPGPSSSSSSSPTATMNSRGSISRPQLRRNPSSQTSIISRAAAVAAQSPRRRMSQESSRRSSASSVYEDAPSPSQSPSTPSLASSSSLSTAAATRSANVNAHSNSVMSAGSSARQSAQNPSSSGSRAAPNLKANGSTTVNSYFPPALTPQQAAKVASHASAAARSSLTNPIDVEPRVPISSKFVSSLSQALKRQQDQRNAVQVSAEKTAEKEFENEALRGSLEAVRTIESTNTSNGMSRSVRSADSADSSVGTPEMQPHPLSDLAMSSASTAALLAFPGGTGSSQVGNGGGGGSSGSGAVRSSGPTEQELEAKRANALRAALAAPNRVQSEMAKIHLQVNAAVQNAADAKSRREQMMHYRPAASWSAPVRLLRPPLRALRTSDLLKGDQTATPQSARSPSLRPQQSPQPQMQPPLAQLSPSPSLSSLQTSSQSQHPPRATPIAAKVPVLQGIPSTFPQQDLAGSAGSRSSGVLTQSQSPLRNAASYGSHSAHGTNRLDLSHTVDLSDDSASTNSSIISTPLTPIVERTPDRVRVPMFPTTLRSRPRPPRQPSSYPANQPPSSTSSMQNSSTSSLLITAQSLPQPLPAQPSQLQHSNSSSSGELTGSEGQPQSTSEPMMRHTMRGDCNRRKRFNVDKPWKGHRELAHPSDKERKRYESLWMLNRRTHLPYLWVEPEYQHSWREVVDKQFPGLFEHAEAMEQQVFAQQAEVMAAGGPTATAIHPRVRHMTSSTSMSTESLRSHRSHRSHLSHRSVPSAGSSVLMSDAGSIIEPPDGVESLDQDEGYAGQEAIFDSDIEGSSAGFDILEEVDRRANDIHGYVVARLWRRSRLPEDMLAQIWTLVDTNLDGTLDRSGFVVGMWLCDQCLYGRKLPPKVPTDVWQSVGKLNLKIRVKQRRSKIGYVRRLPNFAFSAVGHTMHGGRQAVKKAVQTATS